MKKHQEQVYIEERKKLEDRVKQHIVQKKAIQTSMKQQQRQYWNQMKKSSQQQSQQQPNTNNDNFNLKELDLGISKNPPNDILHDLQTNFINTNKVKQSNHIQTSDSKMPPVTQNHDQYIQMMNQNFILQDLSLDSMQSNNYNPFKTLQELDIKVLDLYPV